CQLSRCRRACRWPLLPSVRRALRTQRSSRSPFSRRRGPTCARSCRRTATRTPPTFGNKYSEVILPGATIGVLGGGQLGRMFAMAARRLGYRVHTLAPEDDTPTGQIADVEINAPYDDLDAVRQFAGRVQVVTFEFENVPAAAAAAAEAHAIVRPGGHALAVAQHRLREKTFLAGHGMPVAPFAPVRSAADLQTAVAAIGCPAVLKTAT